MISALFLAIVGAVLEVNPFHQGNEEPQSEWYYNQTTDLHFGRRARHGNEDAPLLRPLAFGQSQHLNPQFVTFRTRDTNTLSLDLNFAFPFINVPIVNTSSIMNLAKDFSRVRISIESF